MVALHIKRANVALAVLEPLQTSQNSQVAINNGTHITILDPKLPSLASGKVLDPKQIYDTTTILHHNQIEDFGIRHITSFVIDTLDEPFNFNRVLDPQVASHKWSPINPNTRDCYLGVLYNTGELYIVKRDALNANHYTPQFKVLSHLFDQLHLPRENKHEGQIHLTSSQLRSLWVTSFSFGQLNGVDVVSIATAGGDVAIHSLTPDFRKLASFSAKYYVKQHWGAWHNAESHVVFVADDNSVDVVTIDASFTVGEVDTVLPASRFLVSHITITETFLVVVNTTTITVIDLQSHKHHSQPLRSHSYAVGVLVTDTVDVAHDNGAFELFDFPNLSPRNVPKALASLVKRETYKHQLINPDTVPRFINLAYSYNTTTGIALLAHKVGAKNALSYQSESQGEFLVSFLPWGEAKEVPHETALSSLNRLWFTEYDELPPLPTEAGEFDRLETFKEKHFPLQKHKPVAASLLAQHLHANFSASSEITTLHRRYNFNLVYLKALALAGDGPLEENLFYSQLKQEQTEIESDIRLRLSTLLLSYPLEVASEVDKYVLLSHHLVLKAPLKSVTKAQIKLTTSFFEEEFKTSKALRIDPHEATSLSRHKWSRCALTLLPLVELNNRVDEQRKFNYVSDGKGGITNQILSTLNYCVFTGNKTYNVE